MDFVRGVQDAGVDFITIHGRTKNQRSSEPVDLEAIKLLAEHCTVPVIANGDVTSLHTARSIAQYTGVDGVMSSRALLANPGLYAGHESCTWEVVEEFVNRAVKAPLPLKLILHHLSEMTMDGGQGLEGHALLTKEQRVEMLECRDMLKLFDWLDDVRRVRR